MRDEVIKKIRLSKMIKKEFRRRRTEPAVCGSSGQLCPGLPHQSALQGGACNPTIRLVVLDEAFSKMDGGEGGQLY